MVVTRIAPSPSGYLHLGNGVNFLLTDWVARRVPGSRLHLRIDDVLLPHVPQPYVDDIFWAIEWLGIEVTDGPSDTADFHAHYSQLARVDQFRLAAASLADTGVLFSCSCSRTTIAARPTGVPDPCEAIAASFGDGAMRFRTRGAAPDPDTTAALHGIGRDESEVADEMGDFVVWRRGDLPSYHLASVVDDHRMGVDTIVRGADLLTSSAAQLLIARGAGAESLLRARFIHHPLVSDAAGRKMSKRDNADALHSQAQDVGGRRRVWDLAIRVGEPLGISPP